MAEVRAEHEDVLWVVEVFGEDPPILGLLLRGEGTDHHGDDGVRVLARFHHLRNKNKLCSLTCGGLFMRVDVGSRHA